MELQTEVPSQDDEASPKLSLNAMNSASASAIMRFTGFIKVKPMTVLLDGESNDNFI